MQGKDEELLARLQKEGVELGPGSGKHFDIVVEHLISTPPLSNQQRQRRKRRRHKPILQKAGRKSDSS
jgi:hypothetical protein